jgi:hypothetical protein
VTRVAAIVKSIFIAPVTRITVDDTGVERLQASGRREHVAWPDLAAITIMTADAGPPREDAFFMLAHRDGRTGCAIPCEKGSAIHLLEWLQCLPGFDNQTFIRAMASSEQNLFACWRGPLDQAGLETFEQTRHGRGLIAPEVHWIPARPSVLTIAFDTGGVLLFVAAVTAVALNPHYGRNLVWVGFGLGIVGLALRWRRWSLPRAVGGSFIAMVFVLCMASVVGWLR